MTPLNVFINRQSDGVTFSLSPSARKQLSKDFPDAHPAGSVFVDYDTKSDFESYHTRVERFVVPVLLGIEVAHIQDKIDQVIFLDPVTNDTIYTYSLK